MVNSSRNGDCTVSHREYIKDIVAGTGTPSVFSVEQLSCNPGQAGTFPWLSSLAQNFESYRFEKLKFDYETEAATSLGGTLVMALDYDASDASPQSKQIMMAYRGSVRSAPWTECCHSSDREDLNKQKSYYVRPGPQPVNTDIKMYDTGILFVASQGVSTASSTLGELYVEYTVRLMTPLYQPNKIVGGQVAAGGVITPANPLGTVPVIDAQAVGFSVSGTSQITIAQPGTYLFSSSSAGTVLTTAALTNVQGATVTAVSVIANAAATALLGDWIVVTSLANATLNFVVTGTTVTSGTSLLAIAPLGSLVAP